MQKICFQLGQLLLCGLGKRTPWKGILLYGVSVTKVFVQFFNCVFHRKILRFLCNPFTFTVLLNVKKYNFFNVRQFVEKGLL